MCLSLIQYNYYYQCCRLKYLNLDNNELITIPHLKLLGSDPSHSSKKSRDEENSEHSTDPMNVAPFPVLQTLSIANNMVNISFLLTKFANIYR